MCKPLCPFQPGPEGSPGKFQVEPSLGPHPHQLFSLEEYLPTLSQEDAEGESGPWFRGLGSETDQLKPPPPTGLPVGSQRAQGAVGCGGTLPHGRHTYGVADGVAAAWKHGRSREGELRQGQDRPPRAGS